jgi:signal transduction histidine kinase
MFVLLIIALIIFAHVQRGKYRRLYQQQHRDRRSRKWDRWQASFDKADKDACKWNKWDMQWRDWERWASEARGHAADVEEKIAANLGKAETRIRREAEKLRRNAGYAPQSDSAPEPDPPDPRRTANLSEAGESGANRQERSKEEEERKAYLRARKRATQEAGFYIHLMWYGIVIGSCLLINLVTSPRFEWWIFPAVGWGVGLVSHFGAVYGWRWIHERVFEPAIAREVQREVTIEKEVLRTEKQASLDELTASFAHEIRNPIAAAKSLVQQMGEDPTSSENVEYAKVALDELARVERSVSHLLKYAKEEDYSFEHVNLAGVLDNALTQMRGKLEAKAVSVSRNYIGGPTIRADADKLRQVFTNVIDNAIDAMDSTVGQRRLELAIQSMQPGTATVVIRDNGCGIPQDKLNNIFNPFYTTKTNGTGLGMGIAKKVMDAHNGRIEVHSQAGIGTEFLLSIPVADALRAAVSTDPAQPAVTEPEEKFEPRQRPENGAGVSPDGAGPNDDGPADLRLAPGTRQ